MELELLQKFITIYGPLALGWPIAWLLWRRQNQMNDQMLAALIGNTQALTLLTATLKGGGN